MWKIRARRLVSKESIPGWVLALGKPIYALINAASNLDWIRQHVDPKPIFDFVAAHGYWFALGAGFVWLSVLVLRGDGVRTEKKQTVVPNSVTVFTHDEAAKNPALPIEVRKMFQAAGWQVSVGQTSMPEHSNGVWVRGAGKAERTIALWALASLGISGRVDDSGDVRSLQIIVGAYEPPSRTYNGEEITEEIVRNEI